MSDVRLIDANEVLCFIKNEIDESKEEKNEARARDCESDAAYNSGEIQEARRIKRHILNAPTIDAVPVIHAYWYGSEFDGYADGNPVYDTWGCSNCHEEVSEEGFPPAYNYCPNCGAKMDGGAEG